MLSENIILETWGILRKMDLGEPLGAGPGGTTEQALGVGGANGGVIHSAAFRR